MISTSSAYIRTPDWVLHDAKDTVLVHAYPNGTLAVFYGPGSGKVEGQGPPPGQPRP